MAPTICIAELSERESSNGSSSSSSYNMKRRRRNSNRSNLKTTSLNSNGVIREERRLELRRILNHPRDLDLSPPASPVWEPNRNHHSNSNNSNNNSGVILDHRYSKNFNTSQRWRSIFARREGLLDIVARTMALIRRSHILQKRVNALRYETREFVRSVLSNPENNSAIGKESTDRESRGMITPSRLVSSSSSSILSSSRPITPPPTPDSSTEYGTLINNKDLNEERYASSLSNFDHYSSTSSSSDDNNTVGCSFSNIKIDQDPMVSSS